MADDVWAPAEGDQAPAPGGYAPLGGLGTAVRALILFQVAAEGLVLALSLAFYLADPEAFANDDIPPSRLGVGLAVGVGLAGLAAVGATLIALPVWVAWHWRAGANLAALGLPHEFGPLAHAGWWFVPFANLVMPYRAMDDLYGASVRDEDGFRGATPGTFSLWWGSWLIGNILSNISFRMSMRGAADLSMALDLVAVPLSMIAGLLYMGYVARITESQDHIAAARA